MKNLNINITKISFTLLLFGALSFAVVQCSSSTDSGNGGGGGGNGGNGNSGIAFDSGTLTPGESFSFTFDNIGAADYICSFHSSMTGSVTVEDGASTNDVTVNIDDLSFNPADITIGPGTRVTWINNDDVNHTATSQ